MEHVESRKDAIELRPWTACVNVRERRSRLPLADRRVLTASPSGLTSMMSPKAHRLPRVEGVDLCCEGGIQSIRYWSINDR